MIVLAAAGVARYQRNLAGGWRRTYVIGSLVALYFNVFVLVVQSFLKVPVLHALAPTGTEAPFAATQAAVLIGFLWLGVRSLKGFRPSPVVKSMAARA